MKLLWTVANWKHTGPLEPSLDLAAAVRDQGHDVSVAVGRPPKGCQPEAFTCAAERGLRVVNTGAVLSKHASPLRDRRDVKVMRHHIGEAGYDAAVTTQRNDHRILVRAAGSVPVARLWFDDGAAPPDARDVEAMRKSAVVFAFAQAALERLIQAAVAPARVVQTGAPLDIASLRRLAAGDEDVRGRFGIAPDVFLFGIVARLQLHRRFEILWDAVARLVADAHRFHVLVLGRGTNEVQVAHAPVEQMGLSEHVTFAGYLRGAAYAQTLAALQAQIFLVPGSDPTCRALREGMSLGVPSVATRRGLLGEIVQAGTTGLLVEETGEALAQAMARLANGSIPARPLGVAAAARADERYDVERVAGSVIAVLRQCAATRA